VKRNVEFVLAPQHETSCDSEIQTKKDFKSKFIKQLGSSLTNLIKEQRQKERIRMHTVILSNDLNSRRTKTVTGFANT